MVLIVLTVSGQPCMTHESIIVPDGAVFEVRLGLFIADSRHII